MRRFMLRALVGTAVLTLAVGIGSNPIAADDLAFPSPTPFTENAQTSAFARITNLNSNKCLVVQGGANGAPAFQFDCHPFNDQHWSVILDNSTSGFYAMLRNRNSGKCLVVQGGANGAPAFQFDCHPEFADQWWYRS